MVADQILDYYGVRHLWQQLLPFVKSMFVQTITDEATEDEIDEIFTD